ncbi:MAG: polyprenyl synthetase family protein [Syntrophomonadaceae bacterium]|nr:polyprenyl synthetase family protein [Syntrophomonadaceae bacterium]
MVSDMKLIASELETRKELIDSHLKRYLSFENPYPRIIHEAIEYAVLNGGKRLRPILVLEGARIAGGTIESVLPVACAVEMIHTYSLVHDDLPAMDNDDYRRGKPTCHKVFGEANAILTGDALLTLAFEILAGSHLDQAIAPTNLLKVIEEIARAVGSRGMIGGQVIDLESEGKNIDYQTLATMHCLKTGELFRASLRSGAILCGVSKTVLAALDNDAYHFGLAFQITDDILDIRGNQALIGKPVGSDEKNGKTTYPSLLGLDKSEQLARDNVSKCMESLVSFGDEADFLRKLAFYILNRNS